MMLRGSLSDGRRRENDKGEMKMGGKKAGVRIDVRAPVHI